jgi:hypothetical protein
VRGFVDSHAEIKKSFEIITKFISALWRNYLSSAAIYIWDDIIIDVVWKNLAPFLSKFI